MANKKQQAEMDHLYTTHYMRAVNGLLTAVGNEIHKEASLSTRRELKRCIASIAKDDPNPQKSEAKCIMLAYNMLDKEKSGINWVGAFGVRRMKRQTKRLTRFSQYGSQFNGRPVKVIDFTKQQYVRFRSRVGQRATPTQGISSAYQQATVEATTTTTALPTSTSNNFRTFQRPSDDAARLVGSAERAGERVVVHHMANMPNLMGGESTTKSPLAAAANFAAKMLRGDDTGKETWKETYEKVKELDHQMKTMKQIEAENRAFDNVLREKSSFALAKTDEEVLGPDDDKNPLKEVQDVNAIIDGLHASEKENLEFLSPKFAPLMPPDGTEKKKLFSPTLFSFYKDENDPNSIASVPDLMNATGFKTEDRDAVLDLIMEASGARFQVEKTLEGMAGLADWQDIAKAMIEANLRLNSTWVKLFSSLTKHQQFELDTKGFSFAHPKQLRDFYHDNDSYYKDVADIQCDIPLDEYERYDEHDRKHLLRRMVGQVARDTEPEMSAAMRSWPRRMKQRILRPFVFGSQILMPSVLTYIILSPTMFVANILSPVIFNFELLSPRLFFPVILGPRLLSPRILGPRVLSPFILAPITLSPAILRPKVLCPFILCPFLMSPPILSPTALGGRVLSPALLNPAIISPGAINVEILSPSLLSKRRRRKRDVRLYGKRALMLAARSYI
uniref:ENTH domain-containing protein n=1 Tax=Plectus sambesii TaxID=2011161 RepID=A0A914W2Y0_9BILA